jgi:hypothetical protein
MADEGITDFFRDSQVATSVTENTAGDVDTAPRGRMDDGLVRTTGWLRLGGRTVSSGLLAVLAGLPSAVVAAVALLPGAPLAAAACVVGVPLVCWCGWLLIVRGLAPASRARNTGIVPASELRPGQWVRRYGRYGPVAQVTSVRFGHESTTAEFAGGTVAVWPSTQKVYLAELAETH